MSSHQKEFMDRRSETVPCNSESDVIKDLL